MTTERLEVSRRIAATPAEIFAVVSDPAGHVTIDSSGMLQSAEGERPRKAGDTFLIHMDREALGDRPIGKYDVSVVITKFEADRLIEWTVASPQLPKPIGHVYGYVLEPAEDGGTVVTSYYDWSGLDDEFRGMITVPLIQDTGLRATLGILARTVENRA